MSPVPALQIRDPVLFFILMKAGDFSLHVPFLAARFPHQ
jgi:hypothetical protein